ncbi:MAG: FAD/NAD(P)-binding protein [Sulfolobales archaeon]|nr:FAD/NAD(P)-binding protein [Sulfolobales archaeon]MCX8186776.1 FAD/NAD(P)-binding protein [Sulfolobales archaeon]MDW7969891.1 FAD/NAD(P)-binding protein [Sulfolobales archaeon]
MKRAQSKALTPMKTTVIKVINETWNVKTYYSTLPESAEIPKPGQFNMLYIHGVGEVPISVSDISNEDRVIAHTVRFAGSVTYAFSTVRDGDTLGFRGPYGFGWPLDLAVKKDLLLICGGIGLPPLRPVIREVARNRDLYGRLFILYGARTPKDLLYRHEYVDYLSIRDVELHLTVDNPDIDWRGNVGVVTNLIKRIEVDPSNAYAFICGPEIMMKYAIKELLEKGFRTNRIYLSLERRMKCGVGLCGHCQMGPYFVCEHGPVFPLWFISKYFWVDQI